jgi:serpin B
MEMSHRWPLQAKSATSRNTVTRPELAGRDFVQDSMRFVCLLLFAALFPSLAPADESPDADGPVRVMARSNNIFGFELYARLAREQRNLLVSPYSVSSALAMTYGGARGRTAVEMASTLHLPKSEAEALHAAAGLLMKRLARGSGDDAHELSIANALWGQKGDPFLDSFLSLVEKNYGAGFRQTDFRTAPEAARRTINAWVQKKTRDRIRGLLDPGIITRDTALVLTNALYFKGTWLHPFSGKMTADRPFRLRGGETVDVPTMHGSVHVRYAEGEHAQALELPYRGGRMTMVVLLPNDMAKFEKGLDVRRVDALTSRLAPTQVSVYLPRFKMTSKFKLAETLAGMGMPTAFTGKADFSGIDGTKELFISAVEHKAYVAVDESGTEAAAATAVVMKRGGPPRGKLFRADRPFLFLIRDAKTGCILFVGRVLDPR